MTVLIGKIAWVILVTGWYAIRLPFERRAKRSATERSARDAGEWTRMWVSGNRAWHPAADLSVHRLAIFCQLHTRLGADRHRHCRCHPRTCHVQANPSGAGAFLVSFT